MLYRFLLLITITCTLPAQQLCVMLNPAGDAQHPGRKLDYNFERGLTLQCAEQIKTTLERTMNNARIVLTRFPGETLLPLQNAHFANRLSADLYVSIHFYQETEPTPNIYLYTFSYGDEFMTLPKNLQWTPYDKAHKNFTKKTQQLSQQVCQALTAINHKQLFIAHTPIALPHTALIGVAAPAIALEIGLNNKDDWSIFVEPISTALVTIINDLERNAS